jgi:hypothetical protein
MQVADIGVDETASPIAFIIHFFSVLIIYLTMLNMLIASIGSSYEEIS